MALVLSLFAHLIGFGSASSWMTAPTDETFPPIEAHLELTTAPEKPQQTSTADSRSLVPARSPSKPKPKLRPRQTVLPSASSVKPPEIPAPELPGTSQPEIAVERTAAAEPVKPAEPEVQPELQPEKDPVVPSATPMMLAQRGLPERIALRYDVQSGDDGFVVGRSTYSGHVRDGRYSLVSVTEATGVTSLFVSGKIIQTSEGKVTDSGLQPELFWLAKGKRRQPPVRFEWSQHRLMLPGGGVELPAQAQDLLSFPFHIAMRVRKDDGEWVLPVTNGKKLREYVFRVLGREILMTGKTQIETLRLQGNRAGEGSLDVWLAPSRSWLPVRIRMLDQEGKSMVLSLLPESG